jgi:glucose-6-phosphate isomerase
MRESCQRIFGGGILPRYRLHWDGPAPEPELRMADDLTGIYAHRGCRARGPIYAMFRDLAQTAADRWWMRQNGLRYDITVIPPRVICGEFVKTKGHYHPKNPEGDGYPEVYEVLEGKAHYLLQREDATDVVLIEAEAGDVVVVPPGYGHVTINPTPDHILHMANIVSGRFSSDYSQYVSQKGAAYYEMANGTFVKNRAYGKVPELRRVSARRIRTGIAGFSFPLYHLVAKRSPVLGYLNRPGAYPEVTERTCP